MPKRYDDLVEVRRRDDVPAEFLWRGRLYVVRDVLAHWIETDAWWQSPAARAVYGQSDGAAECSPDAQKDGPASGDVALALGEGGEREVWQVEASAGRFQGVGVYDLSFDWTAGVWALVRTYD